jgi:hypothetical protein
MITPLTFYLLGCLLALPIVGRAVKEIQKRTEPRHPAAIPIGMVLATATSWIMVLMYVIPKIIWLFTIGLQELRIKLLKWLIGRQVNNLKIDVLKDVDVGTYKFQDRLKDFMINVLVNKTDAFDNPITKQAIIEFLDKCLKIQFTTPKETLEKLDHKQFEIFMKYLEVLVKDFSLGQKNP